MASQIQYLIAFYDTNGDAVAAVPMRTDSLSELFDGWTKFNPETYMYRVTETYALRTSFWKVWARVGWDIVVTPI